MIAEHRTLKLGPLLLKRQMTTMPLLPKIALLSPSISDSPIQQLLDWDKARITKSFGLEIGGALAARQAHCTELSLDGTQAPRVTAPVPPARPSSGALLSKGAAAAQPRGWQGGRLCSWVSSAPGKGSKHKVLT